MDYFRRDNHMFGINEALVLSSLLKQADNESLLHIRH